MDWQDVRSVWNDLGDEIQATWPETRSSDLIRIAGDRTNFARYLSETYDLTLTEATEVIEEWMLRRKTKPVVLPPPKSVPLTSERTW